MTTATAAPTIHIVTAENVNELYALRWKKLIEMHRSGNDLCIAQHGNSGTIVPAGDLFENIIEKIDAEIELDQVKKSEFRVRFNPEIRESENIPTMTYRELVSKVEMESNGRLCQNRENFDPETQFSSKSAAFKAGISDGSIICAREIYEMIRQLGEVTVTISEGTQEVVAVTRQDEDHRVLSVIWMRSKQKLVPSTTD